MTGKYHVKVSGRNEIFEFDISSKITVICGDSGIGKSVLVDLVAIYSRNNGIGPCKVTVSCNKRCVAPRETGNIYDDMGGFKDCIVFIDENDEISRDTEKFIDYTEKTDNYYVLISRELIDKLPNSITMTCKLKRLDESSEDGLVRNKLYEVGIDNRIENINKGLK